MRIPPASVLCRKPTVDDVRRWPDYFITGPGYDVARRTQCSHGYYLTSSCPGCDADTDAAGIDPVTLLDESSPDQVTDVIAVYRAPNAVHGWQIWVNGMFQAATQSPGNLVMQAVSRLGGQVVVRYEDDDSLTKRAERLAAERAQLGYINPGGAIVMVQDETRGIFAEGHESGNTGLDKPN